MQPAQQIRSSSFMNKLLSLEPEQAEQVVQQALEDADSTEQKCEILSCAQRYELAQQKKPVGFLKACAQKMGISKLRHYHNHIENLRQTVSLECRERAGCLSAPVFESVFGKPQNALQNSEGELWLFTTFEQAVEEGNNPLIEYLLGSLSSEEFHQMYRHLIQQNNSISPLANLLQSDAFFSALSMREIPLLSVLEEYIAYHPDEKYALLQQIRTQRVLELLFRNWITTESVAGVEIFALLLELCASDDSLQALLREVVKRASAQHVFCSKIFLQGWQELEERTPEAMQTAKAQLFLAILSDSDPVFHRKWRIALRSLLDRPLADTLFSLWRQRQPEKCFKRMIFSLPAIVMWERGDASQEQKMLISTVLSQFAKAAIEENDDRLFQKEEFSKVMGAIGTMLHEDAVEVLDQLSNCFIEREHPFLWNFLKGHKDSFDSREDTFSVYATLADQWFLKIALPSYELLDVECSFLLLTHKIRCQIEDPLLERHCIEKIQSFLEEDGAELTKLLHLLDVVDPFPEAILSSVLRESIAVLPQKQEDEAKKLWRRLGHFQPEADLEAGRWVEAHAIDLTTWQMLSEWGRERFTEAVEEPLLSFLQEGHAGELLEKQFSSSFYLALGHVLARKQDDEKIVIPDLLFHNLLEHHLTPSCIVAVLRNYPEHGSSLLEAVKAEPFQDCLHKAVKRLARELDIEFVQQFVLLAKEQACSFLRNKMFNELAFCLLVMNTIYSALFEWEVAYEERRLRSTQATSALYTPLAEEVMLTEEQDFRQAVKSCPKLLGAFLSLCMHTSDPCGLANEAIIRSKAFLETEDDVDLRVFDYIAKAIREARAFLRYVELVEPYQTLDGILRSFRQEFFSIEKRGYEKRFSYSQEEALPLSAQSWATPQILHDPFLLSYNYIVPKEEISSFEWEALRKQLLALVPEKQHGDLYAVLDKIGYRKREYPELMRRQKNKIYFICSHLKNNEERENFARRLSDGRNRCADGVNLLLEELAVRYVARTSDCLAGKVSHLLHRYKEEFVQKHGDMREFYPKDILQIDPQEHYKEVNTYLSLHTRELLREEFSLRGAELAYQYEGYTPERFAENNYGVDPRQYTLPVLIERFFSGGEVILQDRYLAHVETFLPFTKELFIDLVYDNLQLASNESDKVLFRQNITDFMNTYYDDALHDEYERRYQGEDCDTHYFNENLELTKDGVEQVLRFLGYLR